MGSMDRFGRWPWQDKDVARLIRLAEHERRYYLLMLEALPVGVAVVSDRRIVAANEAFRVMYKVPLEDVGHRKIQEFLRSDNLIERFQRVLDGDTTAGKDIP